MSLEQQFAQVLEQIASELYWADQVARYLGELLGQRFGERQRIRWNDQTKIVKESWRREAEQRIPALSAIERHVQDMETALLHIESVASHAIDYGYLHAKEWQEVLDETRAALPASGTQTAANAGRNRVAREKEEK